MITVYSWTVPANDPPWMSPTPMRAAVVPDQIDVNANVRVETDPDGTTIRTLIVDAYNRVLSPAPAAVSADFDFVAPPEGYSWPA